MKVKTYQSFRIERKQLAETRTSMLPKRQARPANANASVVDGPAIAQPPPEAETEVIRDLAVI